MAKKTFKDGSAVALQFLSPSTVHGATDTETPPEPETDTPEAAAEATQKTTAKGKRRGKLAPQKRGHGDGYALRYIEKATRRVQLVLPPSLYDKAKEKAERDGVSFNAYVIRLLARATRK